MQIAKTRMSSILVAAVIGLVAGGAFLERQKVYAAPPDVETPGPAQNPGNEGRRPPGPGGLQRAIDQLGLPEDKQQAIDAIVQDYRQKEQQARADFLKQMKEALSPAQYERFESALHWPPAPPPREKAEVSALPGTTSAHAIAAPVLPDGASRVAVNFTGGFDTDPRDHGRPVVLIAAALQVSSDVFRDAFSGVHPAGPDRGGPTDAEARSNKQVLMHALGPYGVTDDRLNEVSNYYRYSRSRGQMWRTTPAAAEAVIKNGVVTGFIITNAGSGYSSAPKVTVPGMENVSVEATLAFGTDFSTNGSIKEIKLVAP